MKRYLIIISLIISAFIMACSNSTPEVTRSMYKVTFLDGEEEYASTEVYYGETVNEPVDTPTKDDYTFRWWNLNGTKYDFSSKVTKDITLQAVWKDDSQAEVKVISEEGKETVYYIDKGTAYTTPDEPDRNGYEFKGWKLNGDNTYTYDAGKDIGTVTEDITLSAVWSPRTYTVVFKYDDNSEIETRTNISWGEIITPPSSKKVSIPEGNYIYYWIEDSGKAMAADGSPFTVKDDLIMRPSFNKKTLTVTFNYGTGEEKEEVQYGDYAHSRDIFRSGYEIDYWHLDGVDTAFDFKTGIKENITLYAEWKTIEDKDKLTVTLISSEHEIFTKDFILKKGEEFNMFNNGVFTFPDKDGDEYRITSWADSNGNVVVDQPQIQKTFTSDTTLYAVWEKQTYTVKFNCDSGNYTDSEGNTHDSIEDKTVDIGGTVSDPGINLKKDGYDFVGWSLNGNTRYDFSTPVTGNIILKAMWKPDECSLTIKYCDGITPDTVKKYPWTTTFEDIDLEDPVRLGYSFEGWYCDEAASSPLISKDCIGRNDRAIYAHWSKADTYTVEYRDASGEALLYTETVEAGKKAVGYTAPDIQGMTFRGWFINSDGELSFAGNSFDFSAAVEENLTLIPLYTPDESYLIGTWNFYHNQFALELSMDENGRKKATLTRLGENSGKTDGTWDFSSDILTISLKGSNALSLEGIYDISNIKSYSYVVSNGSAVFKYRDEVRFDTVDYYLYQSSSDSSSVTCTGGHDRWMETFRITSDGIFTDSRRLVYNGVTVADLKAEGNLQDGNNTSVVMKFSLLVPYSSDTLVISGLFGGYYSDVILEKGQ